MSLQESLDLLAEIEESYPVNEWTAEDILLWPLFRAQLSYASSQPTLGKSGGPPPGQKFRRLKTLIDAGLAPWKDRTQNTPFSEPADALILTYSCARQARLQNRYYDTLLGPIVQLLDAAGRSSRVWEFSFVEPYRLPRATPSCLIQHQLFALQLRHALSQRRMERVELPRFDEVITLLGKRGFHYDFLARDPFLREFAHILRLRDLFGEALDRVHPRIVFTANVSRYEMGLYLACRERAILSVEVQHGVQGDLHGQYAQWTCPPPEGYALLPEAFWSWDQASAETINRWSRRCAPHHRAQVGGIPWFDACAGLDPVLIAPKLADLLKPDPARKVLLITLQPPHLIYDDGTLLPEFVLQTMQRQEPGWIWWLRFHPTMRRNDSALASQLRTRGIRAEFEVANEIPLALLLRRADLHLTHSSSTVLEAERFGVPSIVWSSYGAGLFQEAARAGHCYTALSSDDLNATVRRLLAGGRQEPLVDSSRPSEVLQRFWTDHASLKKDSVPGNPTVNL